MILIFNSGNLLERLAKCSILENMRSEIEEKIAQGVVFSYEATAALAVFPKSEIETFFVLKKGKIKKTVEVSQAANINFKNSGYSEAKFLNYPETTVLIELENEPICYHIQKIHCDLIGWTDAKNPPEFVLEVFRNLNCMPDEMILDEND